MKFKNLSLCIVFICTISMLLITPVFSATYYIKNGGNNGKNGLSDANAWRTIGKVNSVNFADGDIIQFNLGDTFDDANLTLRAVTNAINKTITIQDYGAGDLPWVCGNTRYISIDTAGLSVVIKNINIDGQENGSQHKIFLKDLKDITLDNIEADGRVGYNTNCTPDVDCAECRPIWIQDSTGDVEIKNCTIEYWGGDEDLWGTPATPAYTEGDRAGISIVMKDSGTLSIHDNTIRNIESDCIIMEYVEGTTTIYNNTLWNGGENSVDIKASRNVSVYNNIMGRDATWTGVGGSSTGERLGAQGVIQVIDMPNGTSNDISIYNNRIGPTDLTNFRLRFEAPRIGSNISFYNNYCESAFRHYLTKGRTSAVKIFNNVFSGLKDGGQFVFSNDKNVATQTIFYNNTFYSNAPITIPSTSGMIALLNSKATFKNNIIYINDSNNYLLFVCADSNPTIDHNLFYNANGSPANYIKWKGTTYDHTEQDSWQSAGHTKGLFSDPALNDPIGGDFTLKLGSPAIGGGSNVGSNYRDGWSPNSSFPPAMVTTIKRDEFQWDIGVFVADTTSPSIQPPRNLNIIQQQK